MELKRVIFPERKYHLSMVGFPMNRIPFPRYLAPKMKVKITMMVKVIRITKFGAGIRKISNKDKEAEEFFLIFAK